jgi:hypothetical protein
VYDGPQDVREHSTSDLQSHSLAGGQQRRHQTHREAVADLDARQTVRGRAGDAVHDV